MSEMNDIYHALNDGLRAAEALLTWQTNANVGYDMTRSRISIIKNGIAAYDRLSRDLREGSKHIEPRDDDRNDSPRAANLEKADEGHRLCEVCDGVGVTMEGRMYPSGHTEVDVECHECSGEGQVEIKPDAATELSGI